MSVHPWSRREFLCFSGLGAVAACTGAWAGETASKAPKPNIVIIFTDDQGYQDAGCYGSPDIETPNLDRMAAEGMRFTDFYSASPVCTPSRAALLTGCYPQRVSLPNVLFPQSRTGLNPDEVTIAEMLKEQGYATACYGKWHLGHHPEFLPTRHGFDDYFGLPYSNDMVPPKPNNPNYPDLPLIDGETMVAANPDQRMLTTWYTERAVKFIEENKNRPFFVYLPHSMPHIPLFVSEKFEGRSKRGLYGDVIMEIDWSVGQILDTLDRLGIDENTLVIFSSDNGPWLVFGDHGGSALPLREGKQTTFDGGQRVPGLMRWPGHIPAGSECREMCGIIDLLPTLAALAGGAAPADRTIDGKDIRPLIEGRPGAKSPHEALYFYQGDELQAVRSGPWKLHLPHQYVTIETPGSGGRPGKNRMAPIGRELFNLDKDIGEEHDVAGEFPDIADRLEALAKAFDAEIKAHARPVGQLRDTTDNEEE
jgi:arylsulfatase A